MLKISSELEYVHLKEFCQSDFRPCVIILDLQVVIGDADTPALASLVFNSAVRHIHFEGVAEVGQDEVALGVYHQVSWMDVAIVHSVLLQYLNNMGQLKHEFNNLFFRDRLNYLNFMRLIHSFTLWDLGRIH